MNRAAFFPVFLIFLTFLFTYAAAALHQYHMFQLSSYKTRAYLRNFKWYGLPWKAKKPLVYTPRVIRMFVTNGVLLALAVAGAISYRIFSEFSAFFALLILAVPVFVILSNFLNSPIEKAIYKWYVSDAKRVLSGMPRLIVIGVTGSYGKTSVKYFLARILSEKYNVLMTPESYNTPMGIVKTIRTRLKPVHDVFVCEMGARNPGDIKEICDIVRPRHGVITAIGEQHLETFGTVENIVKTKFELADAVSENGGTIFLNGDSEPIRKKNYGGPSITYSASGAACDYTASGISVSSAGSAFRVRFPDGDEMFFETPLIGKHNVQNITGAVAVADFLGAERDGTAVSVGRLEPVPHRLQLIKRNSIIIIDDSYNSNPSGAGAALETLAMFGGIKILVTPGMVELGAAQDECNRRFGAEAAKICDRVILVGERQTKSVLDGLRGAAFPEERIKIVSSVKDAFSEIEKIKTEKFKIEEFKTEEIETGKIGSRGGQKVVLLENDLPDNY